MTARRLTRLDVVDSPLVARLAHRYGPQRVAVTARDVKQILVGSLIAFGAGWVVVEALVWIATLP